VSKDSGRLSPENTVVTMIAPDAFGGPTGKGACLVVIVGDEIGKRVTLEERDLVIGRSSTSDIQLDMDNVSRNHAMLTRTTLGWVVRDLGSTNGTFVNDSRVSERALKDGDQIRVGRAMLKFLTSGNVEAQYHEEIYRLMTLDGLTQVHNKRHFQEALEREFARSKRYGNPFALVMFDIDHFKKINDTYGHLGGDEVLRKMGGILKKKVRANDIVARVGGEEFAVILPEAGKPGGIALAEKIRRLVEAEEFVHNNVQMPVTVSLGVAAFEPSFDTSEAMVAAADEKLYEAKRGGRNRVCY
jgi:two-component system, cell cycle response regulator